MAISLLILGLYHHHHHPDCHEKRKTFSTRIIHIHGMYMKRQTVAVDERKRETNGRKSEKRKTIVFIALFT